jgi:hypothetical protein
MPLFEVAPSPLSKARRRLTAGGPPNRVCPNATVSTVRVCLSARSCPAPPPVRPPRRRFPRVAAPPRLTPKSATAPHHPLPVCAGARCEEPLHRWNFGHLRCPSTMSGALSTPLLPFSSGTPALELLLPSHPNAGRRRPPEHPPCRRTPPPSRFFHPFRRQEARVSCYLHPLAR